MTFLIESGGIQLEATLREPEGERRGAAVVCHPHPVYGGTMDNRVVYRVAKAASEAGLAALRFNFRGVGASTGEYDEGRGEQSDVSAAIDWLAGRHPGVPLVLAGFSFGAWVGLQIGSRDARIAALVGLGLPLNHYDFEFLVETDKPALYVVGTEDEFCPKDKMQRLARRLPAPAQVRWVEGADHFFGGKIEEMQSLVFNFLWHVQMDEVKW
jgi:uncharacterized protein